MTIRKISLHTKLDDFMAIKSIKMMTSTGIQVSIILIVTKRNEEKIVGTSRVILQPTRRLKFVKCENSH